MGAPTLLWLRRDLRRSDHPALTAAWAAGSGVHVCFVIDPRLWARTGAVPRAWLAANVRAAASAFDGRLILRVGDPAEAVPALAAELGVAEVHLTAETTPSGAHRDRLVEERLAADGRALVRTGSPYAVGPGLVHTKTGGPYRVFTPFARAWREHGWPAPATDPADLVLLGGRSDADAEAILDRAVSAVDVLPEPGEQAALQRWRRFLDDRLSGYAVQRDLPATAGTTGLSPYLKVGAIHPRTLLADLAGVAAEGVTRLVDELAWREFYADVLHHRPDSAWQDLRPLGVVHDRVDDARHLVAAWQAGRTGFPVADAGMRQLATTGWMHNRVRMITASFFCKDLHLPWQPGARFFLDSLLDADLASNNHGWQWVAGTGTDASPYFRAFNPVSQGLRFDPQGDYVRQWVPELRHLPGAAAHEPWRHGGAPGYPDQIVDHAAARLEALDRYAARTT